MAFDKQLLNPLYAARCAFEWLGEKPKHQWTLLNNPLIKIPYTSIPLNRGARLLERGLMVGWAVGAYMGAPVICGMLGLTVGAPLTLPILGIALFNLKANAMAMGLLGQGGVMMGRFLTGAFDQIVNGPDENRPAKFDKQGRQQAPKKGPSPLDRMVALGHMFNGSAGQRQGGQLGGTVIWGDPAPQTTTPTNGQTYEEAFRIPSEDQVRVASSGRESVEMHNRHYGETQKPEHHEAPPAPVYKPPGCDNN